MDIEQKLALLDQIDGLYDAYAATLDLACQKGCDSCCTRNVTLTTLEAYRLLERLAPAQRDPLLARVTAHAGRKRFRPAVTTNQLADLCLAGQDPPEEDADPGWGPCPFLTASVCPVYPLRPFGCRSFTSIGNCAQSGCAEVTPLTVTVNTIFLQAIEHLDQTGCSGNFSDLLQVLAAAGARRDYRNDRLGCKANGLIPNRPVRVLMVPPEHRRQAGPWVSQLQRLLRLDEGPGKK
jgi:Fe-S-cluster containining protein